MSATPDQHILDQLAARLRPAPPEEKAATNGHSGVSEALSNEEILTLCRRAKNAPKFTALHDHGDLSAYEGDDSRADQALASMLAFYTQDPVQLDRLMSDSALGRRAKWRNRPDYRQRTIRKALDGLRETYSKARVEVRSRSRSLGNTVMSNEPTTDLERSIQALHIGGTQNGSEDPKIHSPASREGVAEERKIEFKTAKQIAAETPAETSWAARGFLAFGAITELDGKIKAAGKTTWVSHLIKAVVSGERFIDAPTTKSRVLLLTEQTQTSFRKVLERAGLTDTEEVLVLHYHDVAGMPWFGIAKTVLEKAREWGATVLVIDTLAQFAGIRGDGENNSGEALAAMMPLQKAAAEDMAVLFTRHERKGGGEVGESGRGSSAFGGAVDMILSLKRGEGNARPTVRVVESLSRFDETPDRLVIELENGRYKSLGDAAAYAEREAEAAILKTLPTAPEHALTTVALVEALSRYQIKKTTLGNALQELTNAGMIQRLGEGKKGDPYRFYVGEYPGGTKDSPEPPAPSERMNPQNPQGLLESPDSVNQIHSPETNTYRAEESILDEPGDVPERFEGEL